MVVHDPDKKMLQIDFLGTMVHRVSGIWVGVISRLEIILHICMLVISELIAGGLEPGVVRYVCTKWSFACGLWSLGSM